MSLLTTLARLEAVRGGRAEPLATVRHRHLSERPMVLVPLTSAGEDGAPLAVLLGTDRDAPVLHIVPQPLNRTLRSEFLADLAADLLPYLESFGDEVELIEGSEKDPETGAKAPVVRELCADAPQLVVPNTGGVRHGAARPLDPVPPHRRGRGPGPVPGPGPGAAARPLADPPGRALGRARVQPAAADDRAARAALGHRPEPPGGPAPGRPAGLAHPAGGADRRGGGRAGRDRAQRRGRLVRPPAGPTTDPVFDTKVLAPAIARYDAAATALREAEGPGGGDVTAAREAVRVSVDRLRAVLRAELLPAWHDVWHGLDLLRALPPADHLAERWTGDRWSYTGHRDRLAAGEPRSPGSTTP